MQKQPNIKLRYTVIAAVFATVCLVFTIVLAVVQIKGPQTEYDPDSANTKTVTVAGLRGEIYDCKGRLLVGNSTSYSLLYEYGAMPNTYKEINRELLDVLAAMELTSNADKLAADFYPIEGIYPTVRYRESVSDPASTEYYYLQRVLKRNGLAADTSAEELAEYYIDKKDLSDELYSSGEIRDLMRLWYEMDRADFGQYQSYVIAEDVSVELVTYIQEKGIEGVTFKTVSKRVYNYPGVASHILGGLGKITAENAEYYSELGYPMDGYVGTSGCEAAFESILHGQDGKMVIKYDDDGNITEKYYETEPISGNDVWLTIDIDLQIAAERGLAESAALCDTSRGGAITAMDPNTGAVLAIASYPTYDLTQFDDTAYYQSLLEDEDTPLLNRALQGVYAPGSTYKIGVALAALETGNTSTAQTCVCDGVYHDLHNPKCNGQHSTRDADGNWLSDVDIFDAIQESCNIFFYSLGQKMGIDPITEYTQRLGLGTVTGIELGERTGTVAGPQFRQENKLEAWTAGDDVSAAIGQADHGYTPLQLSVYMSSIVNGGQRFSAHILDSVRNFYTDEALQSFQVTAVDSVGISDESYRILIESMGRVVSENNEVKRYFKNVPVAVGGKTGTAEVNGQEDNALFCGFAPLESPKIVVSCIIEEGQHGYFASHAVAVVMEQYFKESGQ